MVGTLESLEGFTYGADPELFLFDTEKGIYISPDGIIPGTKDDPYKVNGGAIQQDGMAAEFNIDPASNYEEFNDNMNRTLRSLRRMLPDNVELHPIPAVTFTEEVWEQASDNAKVLGCTPDYNAWTGKMNPPPNGDIIPRLRTASGHLHIGWTDGESLGNREHIGHCRDLVKQLDWYLGGWSLSVDPDPIRRNLYGKAGACRFKPYGVEYRVLSNFWVMNGVQRKKVWNRMVSAIKDMASSYVPEASGASHSHVAGLSFNDVLIRSINNSQRDKVLESAFTFPISMVS